MWDSIISRFTTVYKSLVRTLFLVCKRLSCEKLERQEEGHAWGDVFAVESRTSRERVCSRESRTFQSAGGGGNI